MSKKIKEFELKALRKSFEGITSYIVLEPIKVDSLTDATFRKTLRSKKVHVRMVKNTLAKKVLSENGVNVGEWGGITLLCYGSESVKGLASAVDTAIKDARKDPKLPEKFKVKTAVADGMVIPFEMAKTLPTRLEAIGDVLSAILGPGASLAAALTGPGSEIASILTTIEETKPTEPTETAVAADAPVEPPAA